jgi:hypothetical protein
MPGDNFLKDFKQVEYKGGKMVNQHDMESYKKLKDQTDK